MADPSTLLMASTPDGTVLPVRQHPDGHLLRRRDHTSTNWRQELYGFGCLLALAVIKDVPINIQLNRCVYKMLLGEPITAADVASIDPDFAQHHLGTVLRDGGVAEMESLLFDDLRFIAPTSDRVGEMVELIEGGRHKRVTERNKATYVVKH